MAFLWFKKKIVSGKICVIPELKPDSRQPDLQLEGYQNSIRFFSLNFDFSNVLFLGFNFRFDLLFQGNSPEVYFHGFPSLFSVSKQFTNLLTFWRVSESRFPPSWNVCCGCWLSRWCGHSAAARLPTPPPGAPLACDPSASMPRRQYLSGEDCRGRHCRHNAQVRVWVGGFSVPPPPATGVTRKCETPSVPRAGHVQNWGRGHQLHLEIPFQFNHFQKSNSNN